MSQSHFAVPFIFHPHEIAHPPSLNLNSFILAKGSGLGPSVLGPCMLGPLVILSNPWPIQGVHELLVQANKILSKSFPPPSPYYSILGARLAKLARAQKQALVHELRLLVL